jgi:hypothetical protein
VGNRKPTSLLRMPAANPPRTAARTICGKLTQEPPRAMRKVQSPNVLALPFPGLPWLLSFPAVFRPLPDIAVHVEQTPMVCLESVDRNCLSSILTFRATALPLVVVARLARH